MSSAVWPSPLAGPPSAPPQAGWGDPLQKLSVSRSRFLLKSVGAPGARVKRQNLADACTGPALGWGSLENEAFQP